MARGPVGQYRHASIAGSRRRVIPAMRWQALRGDPPCGLAGTYQNTVVSKLTASFPRGDVLGIGHSAPHSPELSPPGRCVDSCPVLEPRRGIPCPPPPPRTSRRFGVRLECGLFGHEVSDVIGYLRPATLRRGRRRVGHRDQFLARPLHRDDLPEHVPGVLRPVVRVDTPETRPLIRATVRVTARRHSHPRTLATWHDAFPRLTSDLH